MKKKVFINWRCRNCHKSGHASIDLPIITKSVNDAIEEQHGVNWTHTTEIINVEVSIQ